MNNRRVRRLLMPLQKTPLHPQWLIFRHQDQNLTQIGAQAGQRVLDVGAGRQTVRTHLPAANQYVSLDYYQTSKGWYHVRPDVYGDGQALPIAPASVDTVLLLDVLEHLPHPDQCLSEIHRVLEPGGKLILQVPFLYPLHDVPLDFHRWTLYGLRAAAAQHGFTVTREVAFGTPLETAVLLFNLALSKTVLNGLKQRHLVALLALLLPGAVLFANLLAWGVAQFNFQETFMPHGYCMTWVKRP